MIGSKDFLGLIKIVIQSIFGQNFFCLNLYLVQNIFSCGATQHLTLHVCLSVCLSVFLFVCLFVCPKFCPKFFQLRRSNSCANRACSILSRVKLNILGFFIGFVCIHFLIFIQTIIQCLNSLFNFIKKARRSASKSTLSRLIYGWI